MFIQSDVTKLNVDKLISINYDPNENVFPKKSLVLTQTDFRTAHLALFIKGFRLGLPGV